MKKILLLIFLCFLLTNQLKAQQEEYTAYLEQALEAVKNSDEKNLNTNLQYFSAAIQREEISPEILTKENLELYTEVLFQALSYSDIQLSNETAENALTFIQYEIENKPKNMFALGRLYSFGVGVPQDHDLAFHWYKKSAEEGNAFAMTNLAAAYKNGNGTKKDAEKSVFWQEKAAEEGIPQAMYGLGLAYFFGEGAKKDDFIAEKWFQKAAKNDHVQAMFSLGILYANGGNGISRDQDKAIFWYEKAAEKGFSDAMYNLGNLYRKTKDPKNYSNTIKWYESAAELGNSKAMYNLGIANLNGSEGMKKDLSKAKDWFHKACEAGDDDGCNMYKMIKL